MDCARSENKGKSEEYNNVVKEKRYGNDVVMWNQCSDIKDYGS